MRTKIHNKGLIFIAAFAVALFSMLIGIRIHAATVEQVNYQTAQVVYDPETGEVSVYFDYAGSDLTAEEAKERAVAQGAVPLGNLVNLIGEGVNIEDKVSVQQYMDDNGVVYTQTATVGVHNGVIVQGVTQTISDPNASEEGAGEGDKKAEDEKPVEYSHGPYDGLNQQALEAIKFFAADEEAGNCYITVKMGTDLTRLPEDIFAAINGETRCTVYFVDSNNYVQYGVTIFPPTDGFESMDLGAKVSTRSNGVYFVTNKIYHTPSAIRLLVYIGDKDADYYVYDRTGKAIEKTKTDNAGFAIIKTKDFQGLIFSKVETLAKEDIEEEEPEEEPEPTEEQPAEDFSASSVERAAEFAEGKTGTEEREFPVVPVAAGAAGVAVIGAGIYLATRKS